MSTGLSFPRIRTATRGGGRFIIPTAPSNGTSVADGTGGVYGSWVEMVAATTNALFITAVTIANSDLNSIWVQLDIGTGAAASEVSVGEVVFGLSNSTTANGVRADLSGCPIPVPAGTRIACRCATDIGTESPQVWLECIDQADLPGVI